MKRKIIFISALMAMLLAVGCRSNNSVVTINKESLSPVGTVLNDEERITSGQIDEDEINHTENVTSKNNTQQDTDIDGMDNKSDIINMDSTRNNKENNSTNNEEVSEVKVKITVGDTELISTWEDNETTRELIRQMPITLPMMDLYGREMCYRYGAYALPTDDMRSDGYEVGDIAYWAPGGSFVILYEQNSEKFERQHIGHIDSGVEIFKQTGDVNVRFEVMN